VNDGLFMNRRSLSQFLRFGIVGVANTATCLAVVWTVEGALGWPVWLASGLGYVVAMTQSYLINRSWTFAGSAALPIGPQVLRFVLLNAVMGSIFSLATNRLAPAMGVQIASIAVLAPLTIASFLATRRFVFANGAGA
jgi:putative flippase GtrA